MSLFINDLNQNIWLYLHINSLSELEKSVSLC